MKTLTTYIKKPKFFNSYNLFNLGATMFGLSLLVSLVFLMIPKTDNLAILLINGVLALSVLIFMSSLVIIGLAVMSAVFVHGLDVDWFKSYKLTSQIRSFAYLASQKDLTPDQQKLSVTDWDKKQANRSLLTFMVICHNNKATAHLKVPKNRVPRELILSQLASIKQELNQTTRDYSFSDFTHIEHRIWQATGRKL